MTPEEYYKQEFEKDYSLTKDIADAKLYSLNSMLQFAELYHKSELPSVEEAGVIAVDISDKVKPKLTAQEQAFFTAGFQECIKYLMLENKDRKR